MCGFLWFDAAMVGWGALVLAVSAVRHFYFSPSCIQIDLPPHPGGTGAQA